MSNFDKNAVDKITRIQALFRAKQVRKHYRVESLPEAPGIVHTKISGTSEHFRRVGIDVEARIIPNGKGAGNEHERTMDILSIDRSRYRGGVAGGDELSTARDKAARVAYESQQPTAFINASYFNYGDARNKSEPDFTPIGPTRVGGEDVPSLPIPAPYKKDYRTLRFIDSGDQVTAGPLLSGGKSGFFSNKVNASLFEGSNKSKYNYRNRRGIAYPTSAIPGYLHHAGDPNARAAIAYPAIGPSITDNDSASQNRIRMMTITPNTGRTAGFTMAELSKAATRVNSWNTQPGGALNLDGGGSASMGVMLPGGEIKAKAAYNDPGGNYSARPLSTIIKYTRKE